MPRDEFFSECRCSPFLRQMKIGPRFLCNVAKCSVYLLNVRSRAPYEDDAESQPMNRRAVASFALEFVRGPTPDALMHFTTATAHAASTSPRRQRPCPCVCRRRHGASAPLDALAAAVPWLPLLSPPLLLCRSCYSSAAVEYPPRGELLLRPAAANRVAAWRALCPGLERPPRSRFPHALPAAV